MIYYHGNIHRWVTGVLYSCGQVSNLSAGRVAQVVHVRPELVSPSTPQEYVGLRASYEKIGYSVKGFIGGI